MSKMVNVDRVYEPVKENAELYEELYDIYCRLYEGMDEKEVFTRLARIQERY